MHPGAIWKKADLQCHTPRDPQWNGPHFKGGDTESEAAREAWADQFVQACIDRQLGLVAITDHHDMCTVPYIVRAIARLPLTSQKPWIFPGMEITCNDSAQCLLIFDVYSDVSTWNRVYGGHLPSIALPSQTSATAPQAQPCGRNVDDFLKHISEDAILSPKTIVLPNGGDEGAYKSIIRAGFQMRFKELPFDGVYTDKAFASLKDVTVKKIHGDILEWGSRRRGIFPTGDNRGATFEKLGVNDCYIKIGEPTTEGLRQVLLADEARIAYCKPEIPTQRVLELYISSTLCGSDFRLSINDGFTALIGGRGSGKSAVLEYLRFGIGRSTSDIGEDEGNERQRNLIADTLAQGHVSVVLERDGVKEVWTRSGIDSSYIEVRVESAATEKITIEAAQQRFRARAFSQKQLSTLVNDRRMADEQLTGIAAAEEIDLRQALEQDAIKAKRGVATSFQRLVQLWTAEADLNTSTGLVNDLERRREAVKKKMEESGISPAMQAVLDEAPAYSSAETMFREVSESVASDVEEIRSISNRLPSIFGGSWTKARIFDEPNDFLVATEETRQKIKNLFQQIENELQVLEGTRSSLSSTFQSRLQQFTPRYEAVQEQQASLRSLMEESVRIERDLENAEKQNRRNKEAVDRLAGAENELEQNRSELANKNDQIRQVLESAAQKVSVMSGGSLRARVEVEAVPKQYLESFHKLCENQRVRDSLTKCEDRVKSLVSNPNGWSLVVDRLMIIYKERVKNNRTANSPIASPQTVELLQDILFPLTPQQAQGIYSTLDDSKVLALLTSVQESFIAFEYKDGKIFIAFEKASPGQQAAALLHLLLRQEAGTLIIDQPEDDLDNKIIMSIVKLVTTAKRRRQLIFSTHNANFVVNGDADKVVALAPSANDESPEDQEVGSRITVEVDGSIETPSVRTLISDTVEGGKEAFELRSRKYSFLRN